MLLRLPDGVLDMLASGGDSANGASISLRWEGQGKDEAPVSRPERAGNAVCIDLFLC